MPVSTHNLPSVSDCGTAMSLVLWQVKEPTFVLSGPQATQCVTAFLSVLSARQDRNHSGGSTLKSQNVGHVFHFPFPSQGRGSKSGIFSRLCCAGRGQSMVGKCNGLSYMLCCSFFSLCTHLGCCNLSIRFWWSHKATIDGLYIWSILLLLSQCLHGGRSVWGFIFHRLANVTLMLFLLISGMSTSASVGTSLRYLFHAAVD